jgi:LysR family transcriptional regulator, cyn operon transcriptional activator
MELRHLRYFVALADELSFTRAARRLNITQSTLSHQIKQLEEEIGHALFDRIGKRTIITAAGEMLLSSATRSLRELDEGLLGLRKSPDPLTGVLRIGATHTFNMSLIPDCLAAFIEVHPRMSVVVEELFASDIEKELESGNIDLGIAYEPVTSKKLIYEPLYVEEMVLAVSSTHPFANRKRLRLAELHKQPLVLATKASLTRRIVDNALQSVGAEPIVVAEINSVAGMLAIVRRTNLGALVSRLAMDGAENITTVALESPTPTRAPGLLTRASEVPTPALRTFIGIVRRSVVGRRQVDVL